MTGTVSGLDRLTVEPGNLGGQPYIRGYRFSAHQLLKLLAAGRTFDEIQESFEFLEIEDVQQVLGYAAALTATSTSRPPSSREIPRRPESSIGDCDAPCCRGLRGPR